MIRSDEMMKDEDLLSSSQSIVPVPVFGSVLLAILLVTYLPNHPKLALPKEDVRLKEACAAFADAERNGDLSMKTVQWFQAIPLAGGIC